MKSLEIVNERIEDLESRLESANYLANGNPSEFGKQTIKLLEDKLQDFTKIKQDLEVLEIIRKKRVDMKLFAMFCVALTNEEILFSYNSNYSYEDEKLTLEELLKLKQWLEVNENV